MVAGKGQKFNNNLCEVQMRIIFRNPGTLESECKHPKQTQRLTLAAKETKVQNNCFSSKMQQVLE